MPAAYRLPSYDHRTEPRYLETPRTMPTYRTAADWLARAAELRQRVLVSCGLWPMPEKGPLNARVFDRVERDGYSVEKVAFESLPGFYVCGNLYRPLGRGCGPFPGVLNPHGHWATGRLANEANGSLPGRCIGFARQGYVAFSWSMIGRNEADQIPHNFGANKDGQPNPTEQIWGLSMMGLQTWNSIRAIDFLQSLPDVDGSRIAVTGESGGGTQTYMIAAADERITHTAPAVMVSSVFQGGCLCENAPLLRLDTFNVEIAAVAAPRPQLLLSCTGDWTCNTPRLEYEAIRGIYKLFDAEDRLAYAHIDAPHNYNQASREACFTFFRRWVLGERDAAPVKEPPFQVEPQENLLCWPVGQRPANALDAAGLTKQWIESSEKRRAAASVADVAKLYEPALRHALAVTLPNAKEIVAEKLDAESVCIGRKGVGDRVELRLLKPAAKRGKRTATLLVAPKGSAEGEELARTLRERGHLVAVFRGFDAWRHSANRFFTTYNRTNVQLHVQDILTALVYLRGQRGVGQVNLVGVGDGGLWCLLARPFAPFVAKTVCDAAQFNMTDDAFAKRLFVPSLRRAGDLRTALALIGDAPLLVHNASESFRALRPCEAGKASVTKQVEWLASP